jgi:hypothetical protein
LGKAVDRRADDGERRDADGHVECRVVIRKAVIAFVVGRRLQQFRFMTSGAMRGRVLVKQGATRRAMWLRACRRRRHQAQQRNGSRRNG